MYSAPGGLRQHPGRAAKSSAEAKEPADLGVVMIDVIVAGGGPTGLMLSASCRWPASKLSSSNDARITRSMRPEPLVCRPEL
jgi:hypothetical protein